MLIIPSIDILGGRAVRLLRGRYDAVTDYGTPEDWLMRWRDHGAELVHVVDLEGARSGRPTQLETVRRLRDVEVALQVGGGVRDRDDVDRLFEAGATRIVVGTAAIDQPDLLVEMLERFSDRIVVSIDSRQGLVATDGWERSRGQAPVELAEGASRLGARRLLVTDILRDGTMTEPNFELLAQVISASPAAIIASGGVATTTAICRLKQLGVEAAIIGRALYEGVLTLSAAREAAGAD